MRRFCKRIFNVKKTVPLSISLAVALALPTLVQAQVSNPALPTITYTEMLDAELAWQATQQSAPGQPPLIGGGAPTMFWTPTSIPFTCTAVPFQTPFLAISGGYAMCVTASFPQANYVDDLPDYESITAKPGRPEARLTRVAKCTKGNFTGELEYTWGGRNPFRVSAARYRITKKNGQQGGNKANINIWVGTRQHEGGPRGWNKAKSSDSMIQNGTWYDLDMHGWHWEQQRFYFAKFEFIFDKSGADPRCTTQDNWLTY